MSENDWISLNVGGQKFATCRSTLNREPSCMLARMFANPKSLKPGSTDSSGAFLIDRSPKYFEPILNYLRTGNLIIDPNLNPEGILEEARYFGIESLIPRLEQIVAQNSIPRDDRSLTRRDVIDALMSSSSGSGRGDTGLRFQGVNLESADLSRLDLRGINFKYANLSRARLTGANLSWCQLERADLSYALMEGAQMLGVKMLCANLEGVNLTNANFEDPAGTSANLEGANLRGANLENSTMAGINLRVATLKNVNMQNCDLRMAVLAGTLSRGTFF
ncbi:BTB/POZ domain-containing protein KCTD9 [Eurytemora carolleeae]|uniref:BTB/POZ domain-containing protein KCTD9 n=1 Tax=Eurytemora carolleeae TaxID=1294199 RepID=UPI000C79560D|nr:BTB/POZ domain-containing protein KCTD9 [Eurytemora carolleeae]|eukprot:XP_023336434.1 BTB/POZ domain-containing protein KCTD9-like [Eurytemora affinis]